MKLADKKHPDKRYERKFFLPGVHYKEVVAALHLHPANFRTIFHARLVNNIYFDSLGSHCYISQINGDMHRRKYRIRWYGEPKEWVANPVLEIKSKYGWCGTKDSYPLAALALTNDVRADIDSCIERSDVPSEPGVEIASLVPAVINRYKRCYLQSVDTRFRITLDSELTFWDPKNIHRAYRGFYTNNIYTILEIKSFRQLT